MQPQVNIPSSTISSFKVEGTNVYSRDGDMLGFINDLVIDKVCGQVRDAALEFGGCSAWAPIFIHCLGASSSTTRTRTAMSST